MKQQQTVMRSKDTHTEERSEVDAISRPVKRQDAYGHKQTINTRQRQTEPVANTEKCQKCGRFSSHNWRECLANNAECRKCRKRGHFAAVCRSTQPVHEVLEEDELQQDTLFLGEVKEYTSGWHTNIELNGEVMFFKIDTGAAYPHQAV